jgi:two-component system chemotaxis sensor kinase CheA
LIFEPGFSTAEHVSNLSGRGVGMDVVRRNIEALRGTVEIDSQAGVGTTVRIRLPLTLAIIDGFLVGVGRGRYVIPLDMVLECCELTAIDRGVAFERGFINLRGTVLPCLWLRDLFQRSRPAGRRENIVVACYGGVKVGLVVDELMGELQTVIKPLGKMFQGLKGISGSTILGSGEVALILDVPLLVQHMVGGRAQESPQGKATVVQQQGAWSVA